MPRTKDVIATGSFGIGMTSFTSADRRGAVEMIELWDAVVLPTGALRVRPALKPVAQLNGAIEYLFSSPNKGGGWTVLAATPTEAHIFDVDGAFTFTTRRILPRSSTKPVSAVTYAGDVFFTLDGNAFFYDPEGDEIYTLTLPIPDVPQLSATTVAAPLVGTYSYRITYVRETAGRFPDEGPASEPASIQVRGTAVSITLPPTPSGLGISKIRIYRATVEGEVVRPYLLVAEVPATTTTYIDKKSVADLGSALFTLGAPVIHGTFITVFLDHIFLADGDSVFISAPYRPTTFQPGFDLAMDEGNVPTGEINALVRMRDGVLVVKRDSLYRIIPSGSERVPFLRGLISDAIGSDSPYGAIPLPGGDVLIASATLVTTLSSGGQENVLGPLVTLYRDLPEYARRSVYLHYSPSKRWTFVLTPSRNFINTEGAWTSWKIPITAACSLSKEGEDITLCGTNDGTIGVLDDYSTTSALARILIRSMPGLQLTARAIAFHAQGIGTISARVVGSGASSSWKHLAVNSDNPTEVSAPVFARGKTLTLEVMINGKVTAFDFTVFGRAGRTP